MTTGTDNPLIPPRRTKLSVDELVRARRALSPGDIEAMAANIFASDQELDDFLIFTRAERRRDEA